MKEKPTETVRLDKWLWAARFYKTRALAREMIEGGKVHYNGQRSKPGKIVELDAMLTLRQWQRRADGAHYRHYRTAPPGKRSRQPV